MEKHLPKYAELNALYSMANADSQRTDRTVKNHALMMQSYDDSFGFGERVEEKQHALERATVAWAELEQEAQTLEQKALALRETGRRQFLNARIELDVAWSKRIESLRGYLDRLGLKESDAVARLEKDVLILTLPKGNGGPCPCCIKSVCRLSDFRACLAMHGAKTLRIQIQVEEGKNCGRTIAMNTVPVSRLEASDELRVTNYDLHSEDGKSHYYEYVFTPGLLEWEIVTAPAEDKA
jgi:hypothetical protein